MSSPFQIKKEQLPKALLYITILLLCLMSIPLYNLWETWHTLVDNPTDQSIHFELDGKAYDLAPREYMKLKLKGGIHTLIYSGETFSFQKAELGLLSALAPDTQYSLLNPTQSPYIFYNEIYTSEELSEEEIKMALPRYECPDKEEMSHTCTERTFDDVFIQIRVDYGVEDRLPHEVRMPEHLKYILKSKLFREDDFINFLEESS